jgi:type IV pilus assembly protein PilB
MPEAKQVRPAKRELGDILVEKGIVSPETLLSALDVMSKEDRKNRRKLAQVLVNDFRANRDQVYKEVVDYYAFKTLEVNPGQIEETHLAFMRKELAALPEAIREMAIENQVLPFSVDPEKPNRLLVVTPDPTNPEVFYIARGFLYPKFELYYVPLSDWDELWKRVNISRSAYKSHEQALHAEGVEEQQQQDDELFEQAIEEEINKSGLVELATNILADAVRIGASDIHVIPVAERVTQFHFRIDGKLTLWYTHSDVRAEAVAAVVKDRALGVDRFERTRAQDGYAQLLIDRKTVRFRVSVIPVVGKEMKSKFESIVIRIVTHTTVGMQLSELGFEPFAEKAFLRAIKKPYGIVIVTGPTGSGKSTTLVAALKTIMDPALNVLTVEDPVEYFIEGARQVKLSPKLDFEGALRAILRHDPDIIMVGEIRDKITADIAVKLANTGHMTLSTLHTNDAPSAVSRLFKMGVEPFLLAYTVHVVIAQRLMRKLCPRCKAPVLNPDREALARLGMTPIEIETTKIYRAVGCPNCIKGYKGRTAIHEALSFTKDIRKIILESETSIDEDAIREAAMKHGMRTLRQTALELMIKGITSLEEVASATVEDD